VPRAGGPARLVAELPGEPARLAAGWDGAAHLQLAVGGRMAAYRVPLAGGAAAIEAPAPWLLVVPRAGGHRVAFRPGAEGRTDAHLVRPGAALDDAAAPRIPHRLLAWTPDGRVLVYDTGAEQRRRVIASGADERVQGAELVEALAPAGDGRTLFYTTIIGHVRRHLVTNFADRPRP